MVTGYVRLDVLGQSKFNVLDGRASRNTGRGWRWRVAKMRMARRIDRIDCDLHIARATLRFQSLARDIRQQVARNFPQAKRFAVRASNKVLGHHPGFHNTMPSPPRRWFAFRLRTLFVLVATVAALALLRFSAFPTRFDLIRPGAPEKRVRMLLGSPEKTYTGEPMGINGVLYWPTGVQRWIYSRGKVIYTIDFASQSKPPGTDWTVVGAQALDISELISAERRTRDAIARDRAGESPTP
jgi:hypothetical protein